MKKTMLICFILLAFLPIITACDSDVPLFHKHSYGEWTVLKEATCTETGEKEKECECGEVKTKIIDMLPHEVVVDEAEAVSCAFRGKTEGSHCAVCGTVLVEQEIIERIEHTREIIPAVEPTKLTTGLTEGVGCSRCNAVLVKQEEIPTIGLPTDVWNGQIAEGFAGGSGTESDPYLISTGAQLAFLADEINNNDDSVYSDKYYKLTNSIDLNGLEWAPIGKYKTLKVTRDFRGYFDGDGYEIYNLKIYKERPNYLGLFGIANGGYIKNLGVKGYEIKFSIYDNTYAGGLVGSSTSSITNCYTDGNIELTVKREDEAKAVSACFGGLAGTVKNDVTNCYSTGSVITNTVVEFGRADYDGYSYVGGLIGYVEDANITNCYSTAYVEGDMKGEEAYVYGHTGGLVGRAVDVNVMNSYATGKVKVACTITGYEFAETHTGGLIGESIRCSLTNSYATGVVTSSTSGKKAYRLWSRVGGLIGTATDNTIANCYAAGDSSSVASGGKSCDALSYSGGAVGYNDNTTFVSTFAIGNVTSNAQGSQSKAWGGSIVSGHNGSFGNNYCYENQYITVKNNASIRSEGGIPFDTFNDESFYAETLCWDSTVWDLSNLDFGQKKYPLLKY